MKKLKLSPNFVDFKKTIIPGGDCFNEEWFFATSIEGISQRETSDFLERATSATSNEGISQQVTSAFLQQAASAFLQRATSATSNERILQRVTSDFLQRATSATSNEQILQRVTSDFTTSNEQRVNFKEQQAMSEKLRLLKLKVKSFGYLITNVKKRLRFKYNTKFIQNESIQGLRTN